MTATVLVDLANKSATVTADDGVHVGSWASGVTRSNVEQVTGWRFVPGSQWRLTPDGGVREVVR